jgi:membrane protease YdiL (CAAX protease family)
MKKSIELIWKEGFLANNALVAPKVNDLYNKKSKHITDKLIRMMKINVYAIIVFAIATFIVYYLQGSPVIGAFNFVLFVGVLILAWKNWSTMKKPDSSVSSYEYLFSFNKWLKDSLSDNAKIMRFTYPLFFFVAMVSLWSSLDNSPIMSEYLINNPETYLINGIPLVWMLGVIAVAIIMAFFGEKIYRWDVNMVYGRVFKKLDHLLKDMEELKK